MPLPNRPKNPMTLNQFASVFKKASNERREALETRNRRTMGSPKKPSPNKPSNKKNSPKRASPPKKQRRSGMSNNAFRLAFEGPEAIARREALYARNAAEYAARLPNMRANAASAKNAAMIKRISEANNAALRAFFKKATNRSRR